MLKVCLVSACSEFKFIMPLIATTHVLNYAKAPTKKLQSVATDIVNGYREIHISLRKRKH